jgi:hypothetical protein
MLELDGRRRFNNRLRRGIQPDVEPTAAADDVALGTTRSLNVHAG